MAWSHHVFLEQGKIMKAVHIVVALAALVPLSAARGGDLGTWGKTPATKCLMDRSDGKLATFAAADTNCGPLGDNTRAPRGYVLSDAVEDAYRAANSGDAKGAKDLMRVLWQIQSRSPALQSCWKTMVKLCDAAQIGEAIEAAKP
jgi:hypothetical protein